jgi:hypothetical protein
MIRKPANPGPANAGLIHPFSVRGFFSRPLWVKSYILYLLLGNVVVKLYFYPEILYTRDPEVNTGAK